MNIWSFKLFNVTVMIDPKGTPPLSFQVSLILQSWLYLVINSQFSNGGSWWSPSRWRDVWCNCTASAHLSLYLFMWMRITFHLCIVTLPFSICAQWWVVFFQPDGCFRWMFITLWCKENLFEESRPACHCITLIQWLRLRPRRWNYLGLDSEM